MRHRIKEVLQRAGEQQAEAPLGVPHCHSRLHIIQAGNPITVHLLALGQGLPASAVCTLPVDSLPERAEAQPPGPHAGRAPPLLPSVTPLSFSRRTAANP